MKSKFCIRTIGSIIGAIITIWLAESSYGQPPPVTDVNNGHLSTDFDLRGFRLLNWAGNQTFPPTFVIPPGSIVDSMVAANAGIQQSKLALTGPIPPSFLGTTSTTAGEGDLVEYKANKGIANGYANLDGNGKVPVAELPTSAGTGTVTSVGLALPNIFTVGGSPVTTAGTLTGTLANEPAFSWWGNNTGASAPPTFNTSPLPVSLIPPLPGTIITSGTIPISVFPTGLKRLIVGTVVVSGTNPIVNWDTSCSYYLVLSGNTFVGFASGGNTDGWTLVMAVYNPSTYTLFFPNNVRWKNGNTQPVQTTGGHWDIWAFTCFGTDIYGAVIQTY
jgi:hypothetical protein